MISNKNILVIFKNILIIIFLVLFFDSIYQFIFEKNFFGFPIIDKGTYRISSFFGSELILGGYIARILPILLSLIFFTNDFFNHKKNSNFQLLLICFLSIIISALSGERVAFFQVIIITLFTIFFLD